MSNTKWLPLYRAILRLYPRAFREKHGEGMLQLVADRLATEPPSQVGWDVARELAITIPAQHWKAHPVWITAALALPIALAVAAMPPRLHYLPLASLPKEVGEWKAPRINIFETGPLPGLETAEVLQRTYRRDGATVQLLVARWKRFQISRLPSAADPTATRLLEVLKPHEISTNSGMRVLANRFSGNYHGTDLVGYYWRVAGEQHRDSNWRFWIQEHVFNRLGLSVTIPGTAVVRVILVGPGTQAIALEQGAAFVRALAPELRKTL